ncbi:MAG: TonB-dependent receptor [Cyclobacteriaceae bacterium]
MKRILLLSFTFSFVFAFGAWAQRTVSGKVTDDNGETVPGINVVLKGTTTGTTTDLDGNYRLSVPEDGGTLVFSFIGLATQEVEVGARSIIDVDMDADVQQLTEVVVTGYGTEMKRDVTGSISNVGTKELLNIPSQSFDRALQGRAAGVQVQAASGAPGGAVNIQIRGIGSLSNNDPLYIVDGVQVRSAGIAGQGSSNPLGSINPQDIESIEILKDAAAAAIYGAQSANGVVIVTTKRGKANTTDVELNFQTGFTNPVDVYDVMSAQELAGLKREAYTNAGLNTAVSDAIFGNPEDPSTFTPYDWVDGMFVDRAPLSVFQFRISGGSESTRFLISGSSESQDGQILMSNWNRKNVRLNLDHKASEKLRFSASIGLTSQNQFGTIEQGNFVNSPFVATYAAQPNSPAYTESGEFELYPAHFPNTSAGHLFNYNIVQGVFEERRESFARQAIASATLVYNPIESIAITVLGGADVANTQSINERPPTIPAFAGLRGQVLYDDRAILNWNSSVTVSFTETFADDHNVSLLIGGELKEETFERNTATGRNFANPALRLLDDAATPFAVGGTYTEWQRAGGFVRGSYNFKNKYYINGTFRRDGHSRFGAQNRVGDFWSVGTSYRLIEEDFMRNVSFLDDLKLRFSYGVLGNANGIGNYEAISSFQGARQYLGAAGQALVLANDQLSWEESKQMNFGVDFGFLKNRLTGSLDVFRNDTGNQLFPVPLSDDSGFGNITANVGEIRNEGIELELNAVLVDVGGFQWQSSFNITFLNNEVLSLPGGVDTIGTSLIVGQPSDFLWGIDYAGVNPANGRPLWTNRAGELIYGGANVNDAYVLGSSIPDYYGGFSNTFSYKGLSVDLLFQYQMGAEAFNSDLYNLAYSGSTPDNQLRTELNRWQNPGDVTNVPIAYEGGVVAGFDTQFGGQATGRYVSDASYIRLKQLNISYLLPTKVTDVLKMKQIRLFANATNLITWTKYTGVDPEVVLNNNQDGLSAYGVYPVGKQYTAGINVKF